MDDIFTRQDQDFIDSLKESNRNVPPLQVGSKDFSADIKKGPGAGEAKHNTFVGEVCLSAGAYVPRRIINDVSVS